MQGWVLLTGLPWTPPCWPLRQQFPSSSIGNDLGPQSTDFHEMAIVSLLYYQNSGYQNFDKEIKLIFPNFTPFSPDLLGPLRLCDTFTKHVEDKRVKRFRGCNLQVSWQRFNTAMAILQTERNYYAHRATVFKLADMCHIIMPAAQYAQALQKPCYLILSIKQFMFIFITLHWLDIS